MEVLSQYIHNNIFRKMCEPQINQPNNNQTSVEYKNPDIEMGYKQQIISTTNKIPIKPKVFDPERIDILNYNV